MNKTLHVFLHDVFVGRLTQVQGQLSFSYDDAYLHTSDAKAISGSMPLSNVVYESHIAAPFFSGLLPDEGVRYRLAKYLHVSEKNIFGLLEAIGGECAGAISIYPEGKRPDVTATSSYLILDTQQANDVLASLESRPFLVGQDDIRISGAGAQNKLMIAFVDGKLTIPKGQTPSTHIIKPAIKGLDDTVYNEFFCMRLAKKVGLITPEVFVLKLEKNSYYVVARYDRIQDKSGAISRLHQEDFCQIQQVPPEIKYENEGGPNLLDCFTILDARIKQGHMAGINKLRLLQQIIFNYLIGNGDAHAKNFSILYQANACELAPCYDLLSTVVYSDNPKAKMAMKIGGEYQFGLIQKKHWQRLAEQMGFREDFVLKQLQIMTDKLLKASQELADELNANQSTASPIYEKILSVINRFGK
jgi:serine/threonine-protein kinase HipA